MCILGNMVSKGREDSLTISTKH